MDASTSGSRPRLVRRFALASLAAFVVIGAAVTFAMVRVVRERAEANAGFHASYVVNAVLAPSLHGVSLDRPLTGAELQRVDEVVHGRILSDGQTVRVKLWAPDGTILYSDDRSLVGRTFPEEGGELADVLDGRVENGVSDLNAPENVGERGIASKLFETYLPLRNGVGGRPVAVAELYQDYSAIQAEIDNLVRVLLAVFVVGLGVLYALLLPIASGASRTLRRKNEQLQDQAERLEVLLSREQESVSELRRLNQMQTDFVAAASHELRTPLTSVIGYLRTLRQQGVRTDPAAAEEFLAAAEHQARRLSLLVHRLLSAAALEEGTTPIETSTVPIAELVVNVLRDLPAGAARVQLRIEDGLEIRTDPDRLREIVLNLVENALKYSADDTPVVVSAAAEREGFLIAVRDEGIGIDPGDQRAI
ncbi:MAG TPA: histidine kinase dimerization/phospho-acceptor domain-containing protein, partial [Actinomycetota bacterium]